MNSALTFALVINLNKTKVFSLAVPIDSSVSFGNIGVVSDLNSVRILGSCVAAWVTPEVLLSHAQKIISFFTDFCEPLSLHPSSYIKLLNSYCIPKLFVLFTSVLTFSIDLIKPVNNMLRRSFETVCMNNYHCHMEALYGPSPLINLERTFSNILLNNLLKFFSDPSLSQWRADLISAI